MNLLLLQGDWCIANHVTDNERLQKNIDFACSIVNCGIIMKGGSCYDPNISLNHASVAMNLYYQAQGRHYWNCNFESSGLITVVDPSELSNYVITLLSVNLETISYCIFLLFSGYGCCKYQYRK